VSIYFLSSLLCGTTYFQRYFILSTCLTLLPSGLDGIELGASRKPNNTEVKAHGGPSNEMASQILKNLTTQAIVEEHVH
jgi:hypothetical protein